MSPRIYLAGPDVFFPDALLRAAQLKALCSKYSLKGVFPLDNCIQPDPEGKQGTGRRINSANLTLIQNCQGVLANISPFRGPSADVGTAFEIGYACALGKKVVAYTNDLRPYKERVVPDGLDVEDFDMVENLMIHANVKDIFGQAEEAIACLARLFRS